MPASDYDDVIKEAAGYWNLDPAFLKSVVLQESGGKAGAVSKKGAKGLTGLMPDTARGIGVSDLSDPVQQIYGGAKYLNEALSAEKTPEDALRYYHGGPNWRQAYGPESAGYAPGVASHYQALRAAEKQAPAAQAAPAAHPAEDMYSSPEAFLKATTAPAKPAEAPAGEDMYSSPEAFLKATTAGAKAAEPEAQQPAAPAAPADQSVMGKIGAGLGRAVHDMTDVPAEYLARGADAIGLTGALNRLGITAPTAPETASADKAGLQNYNDQYGNSNIATAARVGGQVAGTIPMLTSGGGIAGAAGDVGAAIAGRVAPALGRAAEGANWLLSGAQGGGALARTTGLVANGALQGGAAGALTAGQSSDSLPSQIGTGAAAGAVLGPLANAVGAGVRGLAGVSGGATPEVASLAKVARETYGIPITAPQLSENSLVRTAADQSAKLPFSGAAAPIEAQKSAWERAVSRTFGEDTPSITPDTMTAAAKRIGGVFNDVANRTTVKVDDTLFNRLDAIEREANDAPLGHGGVQAIKSQIDNILGAGSSGTIDGKGYQQLTRTGAPLDRAQSAADPNVRYYAGQIRDALDDAFQRSAAPEDQEALGRARGQYRAMKTIEDLVEKKTSGHIDPNLLMGQVRTASSRFDPSTGGMAYTGGGALGDLARIGKQFLGPQPNSGTADRWLVNGTLLGGGGAAAAANPLAAGAVPLGLLANRIGGAYLRSGGLAKRVIKNSITPPANPFLPRVLSRAAPVEAIGANNLLHK